MLVKAAGLPWVVSASSSVQSNEVPKSVISTVSPLIKMLPGLISLWRQFCSCKYFIADAKHPKKHLS